MDSRKRILSGVRFSVMLGGLIGNIITFIIFSRPAFEKNSISVYCRALSVFDSFTIIHMVYEAAMAFFGYYLTNSSDLTCIVYHYVNLAFGPIPGWLLIAFSIDKLFSMKNVCNSLIKKRWFQLIVIASIVLINLLLYIEVPIYLRLVSYKVGNTTNNICSLFMMPFGQIVTWMYLIQANIVPFLIMITTSIISIRLIRKSSNNVSAQLSSIDRRRKRDKKFAVTSIAFNFMFILLRLPVVMMTVLIIFIPSLASEDLALGITNIIYLVNFSSSIIVHLVSNNIFRREFLAFFRRQNLPIVSQSSLRSNSQNKRG